MSLPYFTYIPGAFVVVGKEPDGDSVRFIPDDQNALSGIRRAHLLRPSNRDGSHQLRLDGIDAPETHYGRWGQPMGDAARDVFLKQEIGFQALTFHNETVTAATPVTMKGAILTQAADVHGRPIAYVLNEAHMANPFSGESAGVVTVAEVRRSTNFAMVKSGFAWPLLYTSMPAAHRAAFSTAAKAARSHHLGVWKDDQTERFPLTNRDSLLVGHAGAALIFPKLFRRAMDYLTAVEKGETHGDLVRWLHDTGKENDLVVVNQHEVPLSVLVRRENDRYRFAVDVTEAVFVER